MQMITKIVHYIIKYWVQVFVLIGAFGYVLKVVLDFKFKRKEIYYHLYSTEKLKSFLNFYNNHYAYNVSAQSAIFQFDEPRHENIQKEMMNYHDSTRTFEKAIQQFFLFADTHDEEILSEIGILLDKVSLELFNIGDDFRKSQPLQYDKTHKAIIENLEIVDEKMKNIKLKYSLA